MLLGVLADYRGRAFPPSTELFEVSYDWAVGLRRMLRISYCVIDRRAW
jgi:hypothetical protein